MLMPPQYREVDDVRANRTLSVGPLRFLGMRQYRWRGGWGAAGLARRPRVERSRGGGGRRARNRTPVGPRRRRRRPAASLRVAPRNETGHWLVGVGQCLGHGRWGRGL